MSDLIQRLRANTFLAATHPHFAGVAADCSAAAVVIERLREEVAGLKRDMDTYYGSERDRLRRELAEARGLLMGVSMNIKWDELADTPILDDPVDRLCRDIRAFLAADQPCPRGEK
jgi:hypothetical protein